MEITHCHHLRFKTLEYASSEGPVIWSLHSLYWTGSHWSCQFSLADIPCSRHTTCTLVLTSQAPWISLSEVSEEQAILWTRWKPLQHYNFGLPTCKRSTMSMVLMLLVQAEPQSSWFTTAVAYLWELDPGKHPPALSNSLQNLSSVL